MLRSAGALATEDSKSEIAYAEQSNVFLDD